LAEGFVEELAEGLEGLVEGLLKQLAEGLQGWLKGWEIS